MENETIRILDMVEEGKISSEEAVQLIEALKPESHGKTGKDPYMENTPGGSDYGFEWDNLRNLGQYLNACFGPKAEFVEEKDWSFDAQSISTIDAETISGKITVTGSEENQVVIKAQKIVRAPSDAIAEELAGQVEMNAEQVEDRLKISAERPKGIVNSSASVHYDIVCPRNMNINLLSKNGRIDVKEVEGAFELSTINGKIILESISGSINAKTKNGRIQALLSALTGDLQLSALNGSIKAHIKEGSAPIALKTKNGSIKLILPEDFSGQLEAKTNHGKIRSDYPIITKHFSKRHLTGQIGSHSETPVYLRTWNGSIYLNKHIEN